MEVWWGELVEVGGINTHMHKHVHTHTHTHTHTHIQCRKLPQVLDSFKPDMVVYNAGTDVLEGDPLGILDITPKV